ncbi:unnamed protein product [Darwinula stevensoni]|uniref:Uncharacterized protein n=1 Tax=Darwinula stevensoni TaxID=69355 RepID=A0A7R8XFA0_9CRUS|nr:unnamed protein product [Darwinula stevensoni]CAG0895063.1 unnamed protein product [Darwinula stevensoni]
MFSTICLKRLLLLGYVILPLVIIRLLEIPGWFLHGKIAHSSSFVDPKTLSASELKALVDRRGLDGAGAVEKQDLMQLLESTGKPTNGELQEAIRRKDQQDDVFSSSFEMQYLMNVHDTNDVWLIRVFSPKNTNSASMDDDSWNSIVERVSRFGALYKNIQWELMQHLHDIRSLKELESEWLNTSSQADGKPLRVVFFTDAQAVPLSLAVLSVRLAKGIQVGVFSSSEETEKEEVSRMYPGVRFPSYVVVTRNGYYVYDFLEKAILYLAMTWTASVIRDDIIWMLDRQGSILLPWALYSLFVLKAFSSLRVPDPSSQAEEERRRIRTNPNPVSTNEVRNIPFSINQIRNRPSSSSRPIRSRRGVPRPMSFREIPDLPLEIWTLQSLLQHEERLQHAERLRHFLRLTNLNSIDELQVRNFDFPALTVIIGIAFSSGCK